MTTLFEIDPPKQPSEKWRVSVNFTDEMDTGESLIVANSSVTVWLGAVDQSSTMLVSGSVSVVAGRLFAMIQGGASGNIYKLTFKTETDQGQHFESDVLMPVEDL